MEKIKNFFKNLLSKISFSKKEEKVVKKHHWLVNFFCGKQDDDFVGVKISVERWSYFIRPIVSFVSGFITASLLILILPIPAGEYTFWWLAFFGIITVLVGWPDGDETVPPTTAAMITFMGSRKRWYRLEGDYSWTGKIFLLGRSGVAKDEGTDEAGFILMEPFQIKIWNSGAERGVTRIVAQAKNNASVFTTLTITCQHYDPKLWINNEDPVLSLAERAREGFRGAIRHFTDSDCAGLKNRLGQLMEGWRLVATVMPAGYTKNRQFSVITDRAGQMLSKMIKPGATAEEIEILLTEYAETVENKADKDELELCKTDGKLDIEVYEVEKALDELSEALGTKITDASVGDFQLSEKVRDTADQASSEVEQRDAQMKSSKTIADAAQLLGDAEKAHGQLAVGIAAGADNNPGVNVVIVGGEAEPFTKAAATHGTLTKKGQ